MLFRTSNSRLSISLFLLFHFARSRCPENIEFWSVAIRFRKVTYPNHAHNEEDVLAEAAMIYNRYISETSVLQINIKQSIRSVIKASLQAGEVHKDLFLAAEREICQLMLQDTFTRFKATPLYTQALSMLARSSGATDSSQSHQHGQSGPGDPSERVLAGRIPPGMKQARVAQLHERAKAKEGGMVSPQEIMPTVRLREQARKTTVTLDDAAGDDSRPLMFGGKSRVGAPAPSQKVTVAADSDSS